MNYTPSEWYKQKQRQRIARRGALLSLIIFTSLMMTASATYVYEQDIEPTGASVVQIVDALAGCESGNDPDAINHNEPHGKSYGLLQFRLDTFNHFGERYGLPHTDIFDPAQQRAIAEQMILDGRESHWACYKKLWN